MTAPHEVLGLKPDATADEIRKAYHRLSKKYHPDHNPGDADAAAKFRAVRDAYDALTGSADAPRSDDDNRLMPVLVPVFTKCLHEAVKRGLKTTDVVGLMKREVRTGIEQLTRQRRELEESLNILNTAVGRLSTTRDGENLLASVARSQIKETEALLKRVEEELSRVRRALEFLETCRYLTDDPYTGAYGTVRVAGYVHPDALKMIGNFRTDPGE